MTTFSEIARKSIVAAEELEAKGQAELESIKLGDSPQKVHGANLAFTLANNMRLQALCAVESTGTCR